MLKLTAKAFVTLRMDLMHLQKADKTNSLLEDDSGVPGFHL